MASAHETSQPTAVVETLFSVATERASVADVCGENRQRVAVRDEKHDVGCLAQSDGVDERLAARRDVDDGLAA